MRDHVNTIDSAATQRDNSDIS